MYLIVFLSVPLVSVLICIKLIEKRLKKKHGGVFRGSEGRRGNRSSETAGFEIVIAQRAKDIVSSFKG